MGRISGGANQGRKRAFPARCRAVRAKGRRPPASGSAPRSVPAAHQRAAETAARRIFRQQGQDGGWLSGPAHASGPGLRRLPPPGLRSAEHRLPPVTGRWYRERPQKLHRQVCRQVPPSHSPEAHRPAQNRDANAATARLASARSSPWPVPRQNLPQRPHRCFPPHRPHARTHAPVRLTAPHPAKQCRWTSGCPRWMPYGDLQRPRRFSCVLVMFYFR